MRLEVDPNSEGPLQSNGNVNHQNDQEKFAEYLNAGVKAAQSGDRKTARRNLMSALDIDAQSENAWLWLASISEYPEELLVFLNNVLDINPKNERALQWSASTKLLLSKTLVQRGIDAHENDRHDFAVQCFDQALSYDVHNANAWLWLAALCESEEKRLEYFARVLEIDPENQTAKAAVEAAESNSRQTLFNNAAWCATNRDMAGANQFLDQLFAKWPADLDGWTLKCHLADSLEERRDSCLQLIEFDADNTYAKACLSSLEMIQAAAQNWTEPVSENLEKQQLTETNNSSDFVEAQAEEQNFIELSPATAVQAEDHSGVALDDEDVLSQFIFEEPQNVEPFELPAEIIEDLNSMESDTGDSSLGTVAEQYETVELDEMVPAEMVDDEPSPFDSVAQPIPTEAIDIVDDRPSILVVENNPTARKLMAGKLEKSGYKVLCAESGREGVEMARTMRPALVLADIAMPGMDGYAICRTLRDNTDTREMPVVLISGKDGFYEEGLGQASGASGFITKPFGPETLMKTVENFLAAATKM